MAKANYISSVLCLLFCCEISFSQQEVLPSSCDTVPKQFINDSIEKVSLVKLIKAKENPGCRWRDEESGFAAKTMRLMKITSLQEKVDLFDDSSIILKYYLFPYILYENDSIGIALLKKTIDNKTELVSFCSCMIEDDPINLRLALLYYSFIQLKYYWGTSGTIDRVAFWFDQTYRKRVRKKIWNQKLSELKQLLQNPIPRFRDYLLPSGRKAWD
ncbi:MAG TPA: hypothetical protein VI461_16495 [Chitinophagaceae bacterium]|nr:hypothetical protein [Chitinophagaceae bacterium]